MDIKEYALGGVVVIGGVAYGVSQGGLGDALSEDVKYISAVSQQERPAYMEGIVEDFTDNFSTYLVQTENYYYVGQSKFSFKAEEGLFVEVVKSEDLAKDKDIKAVQAEMKNSEFCAQAEMTMFTYKGWEYRFILEDQKGYRIYQVTCRSNIPKLRVS